MNNVDALHHPLITEKLIAPNYQVWHDYTHHNFVQQLGLGTLPVESFQYYLQQDYLFLKHYARAYALAIYKSKTVEQMSLGFNCLAGLLGGEMNLHLEYCTQWGIEVADIESLDEGAATVAYTRFVLDAGLAGDLLDLYVALAPCALGYAQIGTRLFHDSLSVKEGNSYWPWIETYASDDFTNSVNQQMSVLETLLADLPADSPRWQELQRTFSTATRMEVDFWQQGLFSPRKSEAN